MKHKNQELMIHAILCLILLSFILFNLPLIGNAGEDRRMVGTFDTDEWQEITKADYAMNNWLDPNPPETNHFLYGSLYYYLSILLFLPFKLSGLLSDRVMILVMRSISLVASCMTIYLLFHVGKKFFNSTVGILSAFLMATNPHFIYWSTVIHPDTLQLLFLVACIHLSLKYVSDKKIHNLYIASFFAGLTFGTKYAGIYLIPLLYISYMLSINIRKTKKSTVLKNLLIIPGFFFIAFAFTNPHSIIKITYFLQRQYHMSKILSQGGQFDPGSNWFIWFDLLRSNKMFGESLFVIISVSLIYSGFSLIKKIINRKVEIEDYPILILTSWILLIFLFVFFRVNYRVLRYMLPIVPAAYLVTASTIFAFKEKIAGKSKNLAAIFYIIILCVLVSNSFDTVQAAIEKKDIILSRSNDIYIPAGHWILENYPHETRILCDKYTYIPPKFKTIHYTWNVYEREVDSFNPDLIVINDKVSNRFMDPEKANSYKYGSEEYMMIYEYYRDLKTGKNTEFKLVKDFDRVKIYQREC